MTYVPAQGDPFSPIWIVGEAPGEQEEQQRQPFCGSSGLLLNQCLSLAGISRSSLYVTNVCHYRPPGNDITQWMHKGKDLPYIRNGFCYNDLVAEGLRELDTALATYKPRVVITLGNVALWALTGNYGIETWRGSIIGDGDTRVIPTYHPAFVLRVYEKRVELMADLQRAFAEAQRPSSPDWRFHVNPSLDEALSFLANLPPVIAVDIETAGNQISCVGIARDAHEAMSIPIAGRTLDEELILVEALRDALERHDVVGQNFLYDRFYLSSLWGIRPRVVFDTMIAQGLLFPGQPKGLDYLASLYARYYCYWKHDPKQRRTQQELLVYNCTDCVYTYEVYQALNSMVDAHGQREQFAFLMALCDPIIHMEFRGVRVDPELLRKLGEDVQASMQQTHEFLEYVLDQKIVPTNNNQLKRIFYEDLKLKPIYNRKRGSVSLDKEAMQVLREQEPAVAPVLDAISRYRTLHIIKSSVIESTADDGRLYTSFNPVGTVTFRFSSSENPFHQGTNLQNIAKVEDGSLPDIRQALVPDPGMSFLEFDLSKADLRVVVWESEEEELKEALRKGINIYKDIAADVVKMPYRRAKMFVHGTNYGGKARTMAMHCKITVHEAEVAQRRWFERFPGIKRWHTRVQDELTKTSAVRNKFGFRMLFFSRLDSCLPKALAWTPQSTVAIVVNKALLELYRRGYDVLLQIHDSVLLQVPTGTELAARDEILSVFNSIVVPYDDPLVIPAEGKMGTACWSKMVEF